MADMSVQGINDLMSSIRSDYPSSIARVKGTKAINGESQSFDDVMATGFSDVLKAFPASQVSEPNRVTDLMNKVSTATDATKAAAVKVSDNVKSLKKETTEAALEEAVHEAGQEMIRKTSEVLNVSEETVTDAMETLSMTEADLLNPENLSTLTMEITGTNESELLTNDALFQDLQQLMDTASELTTALLDQFDLTDAQLTTAIENLSAGLNMDLMQTAFVNPEVQPDNPLYTRVEATDTASRVGVNVEEEGDMVMQEEDLLQENGAQNNLRTTVEQSPAGQETGSNAGGQREREELPVEFTNALDAAAVRVNDTAQQPFVNQLGEVVVPEPMVDPQEILRQITDYIRVEAKPDVTTMELALHPQSLGHVIVQVSEAADGNMTARFLTQNETVRDAIAQQMSELIQRFDEQGLKVTEVSVTVESHAFEQNLQQGAGDPNAQGDAQNAPRASRPRRISLDEEDLTVEGIGEMSEAEILAADMMARSGNRLDYMA